MTSSNKKCERIGQALRRNKADLKCDGCGLHFSAQRRSDGRWRTNFVAKPPSPRCHLHKGTPLCRWEVCKARNRLWRQVEPLLGGEPLSFVTLAPPRRTVSLKQIANVEVANELRALTRKLAQRLPAGVIAIGCFDVSLRDDVRHEERQRYWVAHSHLLVIGLNQANASRILKGLYKRNKEVVRPVRVQKAPNPRAAISYSLKHLNDIDAGVLLPSQPGSRLRGARRRNLKPDEKAEALRLFSTLTIREMLLLIGVKRFGNKLRRL